MSSCSKFSEQFHGTFFSLDNLTFLMERYRDTGSARAGAAELTRHRTSTELNFLATMLVDCLMTSGPEGQITVRVFLLQKFGNKRQEASVRCIIALLFGTALLRAGDPKIPAAAFYWDATSVAIVAGEASGQVPQNATKMPDPNLRAPFGEMFAIPEVSNTNGFKTGDIFDTGNFWVRATVNRFIYNKTEYAEWMLAIATIDPDNQEQYAAAIQAKLRVFLAEPAKPERVSDTGQIRNPVVKTALSASERAALEANLNEIMTTKLQHAILKEQSDAPRDLLSPLLGGNAKLTLEVNQVDLGQSLGVGQHVLGTWTIGDETVFSVQGWKRPDTDGIESLEAIDGLPEDKAEIIGAIGDWGEESVDNFEIENVFSGGRLVRHLAGYEHSSIYLERMSEKGREFVRSLYGL